jgi:hypothetical protein
MAEILAPAHKPIADEFQRGFDGMTVLPVSIEELITAREAMITSIVRQMPDVHQRFLLSFECGEPDWPLLDIPGAHALPAVRWRQRNLDTLSTKQRTLLISQLEAVLFASGTATGTSAT